MSDQDEGNCAIYVPVSTPEADLVSSPTGDLVGVRKSIREGSMTAFSTASRLATLALGAALAVALQSGAARSESTKQFVDYTHCDTPLSRLLCYGDANT